MLKLTIVGVLAGCKAQLLPIVPKIYYGASPRRLNLFLLVFFINWMANCCCFLLSLIQSAKPVTTQWVSKQNTINKPAVDFALLLVDSVPVPINETHTMRRRWLKVGPNTFPIIFRCLRLFCESPFYDDFTSIEPFVRLWNSCSCRRSRERSRSRAFTGSIDDEQREPMLYQGFCNCCCWWYWWHYNI